MKLSELVIGKFAVKGMFALALVAALLPAFAGPADARSLSSSPNPAATPAPKKAAAAKPTAGKIALMTSTGGDILLLDPVTGKLQRLTDGMDPALSPDGSKLAFARWGPSSGLYVRELKTGEERLVVGAQKPRHPSWSSDGQKLAFVHLLKTISCRESVLGCLPEDRLRALFRGANCVSTTAGKLCISEMPVLQTDETGIVEIGLDGKGWEDMPAPSDAQSVSWRPNGDDLLFRGNNRLQLTGPGQIATDIVTDAWFGSPIWSPDGTQFVAQKRIHDHTDLALFDASGRFIKFLTAPPSVLERSPHNVAPAWSLDGKSILFLTDREGGEGNWQLYRMNADGSGQAPFMPKVLKGVTFRYEFAAERVASWGK